MTDCVIIDDSGRVNLGKALTNCGDESASFLDSVRDAVSYVGLPSEDRVAGKAQNP